MDEIDLTVMFLSRIGAETVSGDASIALLSYPFLATSSNERLAALSSNVAAEAARSLGREHIFPLGFFGGADAALYTVAQTRTAAEFKGLTFESSDPVLSGFLSELGAVTSQLEFDRVIAQMREGDIDGVEVPMNTLPNFFDVGDAREATVWPEFRNSTGAVLVSSETWDRLSPRQHRQVDAAFVAAQRRGIINQASESENFLKETGNGRFYQIASADARSKMVAIAEESFRAKFGEEGDEVLQELYDAIEASRLVEESEGSNEEGSLQLLGTRVFFITDRRYFPDEDRLVDRFGAAPNQAPMLRCGEFKPDMKAAPLGVYQSDIVLKGELQRDQDLCLAMIKDSGRLKLILIHGYANTFEDATRRALALARDLNIDDADLVLWSWPSAGTRKFGAYSKDEGEVERSAFRFNKFLQAWYGLDNEIEPMIIAHSMGTRMIGMLIENMQENVERFTFVLAGADVSSKLLKKVISNIPVRMVHYVSSRDLPLFLSMVTNFRTAAGADPSLAEHNTEVVDLSKRYRDHAHVFVKHGPFDDLRDFVRTKNEPAMRGLFQKEDRNGFIYWVLPISD